MKNADIADTSIFTTIRLSLFQATYKALPDKGPNTVSWGN